MDGPAMKLSIKSEKEVSIDQVVKEANAIWKFARNRKLKFGDAEKTNELLEEIRKKHPQFCQSYPIVSRYICQMQEYSAKAFRMWLIKIKEHPWKSPEEYMDAQADYVVKLYCSRKPHANKTEISNIRTNIRGMLMSEYNHFKSCAEQNDAAVTLNEEKLHSKNSDELFRFAKLAGVEGISKAETIRFESDVKGDIRDLDSVINEKISANGGGEKLTVSFMDLL